MTTPNTASGLKIIIPDSHDLEDGGVVSMYPSHARPGMYVVHVVSDGVDASALSEAKWRGLLDIAEHLESVARQLRALAKK